MNIEPSHWRGYDTPPPRESSWAKTGSIAPLAFTTLAGKLGVQAYINKTPELDLTQEITLELVYL